MQWVWAFARVWRPFFSLHFYCFGNIMCINWNPFASPHRCWEGNRLSSLPRKTYISLAGIVKCKISQNKWWSCFQRLNGTVALYRQRVLCSFGFFLSVRLCGTSPDLDGGVMQDLPVAVPGALGGAVVAGPLGGAERAEARRLAQVFRRGPLAARRLEAELPHPVDLHERVVELGKENGGNINEGWMRRYTRGGRCGLVLQRSVGFWLTLSKMGGTAGRGGNARLRIRLPLHHTLFPR